MNSARVSTGTFCRSRALAARARARAAWRRRGVRGASDAAVGRETTAKAANAVSNCSTLDGDQTRVQEQRASRRCEDPRHVRAQERERRGRTPRGRARRATAPRAELEPRGVPRERGRTREECPRPGWTRSRAVGPRPAPRRGACGAAQQRPGARPGGTPGNARRGLARSHRAAGPRARCECQECRASQGASAPPIRRRADATTKSRARVQFAASSRSTPYPLPRRDRAPRRRRRHSRAALRNASPPRAMPPSPRPSRLARRGRGGASRSRAPRAPPHVAAPAGRRAAAHRAPPRGRAPLQSVDECKELLKPRRVQDARHPRSPGRRTTASTSRAPPQCTINAPHDGRRRPRRPHPRQVRESGSRPAAKLLVAVFRRRARGGRRRRPARRGVRERRRRGGRVQRLAQDLHGPRAAAGGRRRGSGAPRHVVRRRRDLEARTPPSTPTKIAA